MLADLALGTLQNFCLHGEVTQQGLKCTPQRRHGYLNYRPLLQGTRWLLCVYMSQLAFHGGKIYLEKARVSGQGWTLRS